MKCLYPCVTFLILCFGCAKQASLPPDSRYNVTGVLNDSVWFGTGKVLRLRATEQRIEDVRKFNLIVFTDIDYPGAGKGPNPKTSNGCLDPECTRTQSLAVYNIPIKRGRYKISKLNRSSQQKNEYANMSYIGNAGGVFNRYIYERSGPGWIKITKFDKALGIVEGRFAISFTQDNESDILPLRNKMPATAQFTDGLFRIKVTDVLLR